MIDCYISLGSNLGDSIQNISNAINAIARETILVKTSAFYQTTPVGFESNNNFINACILIQAKKTPLELLTFLKKIESDAGRTQKSHNATYSDRIIDLDIVFFGDTIIETEELTLPHPKFWEREFVLRPLLDLNQNLTDPRTKLTISQYFKNIEHCESIVIVNNS